MQPKCAVVDGNMLAMIGLRQILEDVMPILQVDTFSTMSQLRAKNPEQYVHFFVAQEIVVANMPFFNQHKMKTIVLTSQNDASSWLNGFHSICTNQDEESLVRQFLTLVQHAHAHGRNLPPIATPKVLSDREIEVLSLIVRGFINKEIAEKLNISLTTVISHRKNIMTKLGIRSVSGLTIYAVMHGYVDISSI
ncbi:MAG: response regulator transcription factor [Prevotella sp.]